MAGLYAYCNRPGYDGAVRTAWTMVIAHLWQWEEDGNVWFDGRKSELEENGVEKVHWKCTDAKVLVIGNAPGQKFAVTQDESPVCLKETLNPKLKAKLTFKTIEITIKIRQKQKIGHCGSNKTK